jgi:hypothetical protein
MRTTLSELKEHAKRSSDHRQRDHEEVPAGDAEEVVRRPWPVS